MGHLFDVKYERRRSFSASSCHLCVSNGGERLGNRKTWHYAWFSVDVDTWLASRCLRCVPLRNEVGAVGMSLSSAVDTRWLRAWMLVGCGISVPRFHNSLCVGVRIGRATVPRSICLFTVASQCLAWLIPRLISHGERLSGLRLRGGTAVFLVFP